MHICCTLDMQGGKNFIHFMFLWERSNISINIYIRYIFITIFTIITHGFQSPLPLLLLHNYGDGC